VAQLKALVLKLQARIEALEAENARLRRDSSNSHKPPSSDIVKPPRPRHGKKGKIGGQPVARAVGRRQHRWAANDGADDSRCLFGVRSRMVC